VQADLNGPRLRPVPEHLLHQAEAKLSPDHRPIEPVEIFFLDVPEGGNGMPVEKHIGAFWNRVVHVEGGIKAIYFRREDGRWTSIVWNQGLTTDPQEHIPTLVHELREMAIKQERDPEEVPKHWVSVHNQAENEGYGGGRIDVPTLPPFEEDFPSEQDVEVVNGVKNRFLKEHVPALLGDRAWPNHPALEKDLTDVLIDALGVSIERSLELEQEWRDGLGVPSGEVSSEQLLEVRKLIPPLGHWLETQFLEVLHRQGVTDSTEI